MKIDTNSNSFNGGDYYAIFESLMKGIRYAIRRNEPLVVTGSGKGRTADMLYKIAFILREEGIPEDAGLKIVTKMSKTGKFEINITSM